MRQAKATTCNPASVWASLIVFDEPAEFGGPSKGPLDDPAARKQDKAAFRLGQLDDFKADPVALGGLGGALAGVALVNPGDFDIVAGDRLHRPGKGLDLAAILSSRRGDMERQQMPDSRTLRSTPESGEHATSRAERCDHNFNGLLSGTFCTTVTSTPRRAENRAKRTTKCERDSRPPPGNIIHREPSRRPPSNTGRSELPQGVTSGRRPPPGSRRSQSPFGGGLAYSSVRGDRPTWDQSGPKEMAPQTGLITRAARQTG